jgi:hypothetical protein
MIQKARKERMLSTDAPEIAPGGWPDGHEGAPLSSVDLGLPAVYQIDPLADVRWQDLLQRHPAASAFHSAGWLQALQRTYGYEPIVFTTSQPGVALTNGLLCAQVRSWFTGARLVSLPFSDHCVPLCGSEEQLAGLLLDMQRKSLDEKWKYIEVRPLGQIFEGRMEELGFEATARYLLHRLDLEPSEGELFHRLHKNCVQRRVRHAERAGVQQVSGNTGKLLRDFYGLMVRTRIRHCLPPQPFAWFRNLLECMSDGADLRVAYLKDIPIAAILILHFRDTSYFKYGCSDERFHRYGAFPFLLWRAILKAKSVGSRALDLGRTDDDDHGLIFFKDHWTNCSEPLKYWVWAHSSRRNFATAGKSPWVKGAVRLLPRSLVVLAGSVIYRHIG